MSSLSVNLILIAIFCSQAITQGSEEMERRLNEMENTLRTQQKQLTDLQERFYTLEANRRHQVQDETQKISANSAQAFQDCNTSLKSSQSANVSLYVYLSGDRCYSTKETFIYDVVETNNGFGYNRNDGIFEVPVAGVYVLTVTVACMQKTFYTAELVVNGTVKGRVSANAYESNEYHTGSITTVVYVSVGQHVFVRRAEANRDCCVHSGYTWTSFTGWLLF